MRSSAAASPRPRSAFAPTVSSRGSRARPALGGRASDPAVRCGFSCPGPGRGRRPPRPAGREEARRGAAEWAGRSRSGFPEPRPPRGYYGAGTGRRRCDPLSARASGLGAFAVGSVHPDAGKRESQTASVPDSRCLLSLPPASRLSNDPVSEGGALPGWMLVISRGAFHLDLCPGRRGSIWTRLETYLGLGACVGSVRGTVPFLGGSSIT